MQAIADHGVEEGQELSHAGGECDLAAFAGGFESLIEGSDDGVASCGGEGGHVECGADVGASASDGACALESAGVSVEGRDADQCADLSSVGGAQFVERGDECGAEYDAGAGDGSYDFVHAVEVVVGVDEFSDLLVQRVDLFVDGFEYGVDGFACVLGTGDVAAVGLLGARLTELTSAGDQGVEFGLFLRGFLGYPGLCVSGELDEDLGVDGVCFSEDAQCFGEVSDAAWVDQCDGQADVEQRVQCGAFVSAGGLDDDEFGRIGLQGAGKLLDACVVVGERDDVVAVGSCHVEFVLGDVDADEQRVAVGVCSVVCVRGHEASLSCECERADLTAEALSAVRAMRHEADLDHALWRSWKTKTRSVVGRPSRPRASSLRSSARGRDRTEDTMINIQDTEAQRRAEQRM